MFCQQEPSTLINDLTETQILKAIRERFEDELVEDMDMKNLIANSTTLAELFETIQVEIDGRDRRGESPNANSD